MGKAHPALESASRVCESMGVLRTLRDWACSVLFVVVFGLSMVVWDVFMRIGGLIGKRAETYVAGALQWWLLRILWICGIRMRVERSPKIEPGRSYIIVSNHQSMFDMPIHGSIFFWNFPKYIAKKELAKWIPSVSVHLRHGGHAIIDRRDRASAVHAIEKLAREVVNEGFSAVIFPEGTRGKNGMLKPFKPAGTVALLKQAPDAPVVPVCIDESWRLMEHGLLPLPVGITLRAWIGDPIPRRPDEDPYAIVASCERQIQETMARFRNTTVDAVLMPVETPAPSEAATAAVAGGRSVVDDAAGTKAPSAI
jgi:1-acyl-sn-glycerol-3-phosphate acyltransferase